MVGIAALAGLGGGVLAPRPERAAVRAAAAPPPPAHALDPRIEALLHRVAALEVRPPASAAPTPASAEKKVAPAPPHEEETEPVRSEPDAADAVVALIEQLVARQPYSHERSERFFEHLSRRHGDIDGAIRRLRAAIVRDPKNAQLHAALGTALAAKTAFATPPGPEQGTVWDEAEAAFKQAIELDPDHWEARYALAFGDSMAPEFVGLRPRAIERFEELMDLQERGAPSDDHVLVYARLGTLYKDAGNTAKAREVWRRGLARFPASQELEQSLKLLGEEPR
jgi:tetratricopeptide (TPR) repeat protein